MMYAGLDAAGIALVETAVCCDISQLMKQRAKNHPV